MHEQRAPAEPSLVSYRARLPVPVRAPSPQELDDDDFLFLEDDAPLLFSLKRKTQSQRQTSKKAETETRTTTGDGASSENELGTGGNTASTSEPPPKGPATHKKRGKQGKPTDAGEGASTEAHEVGGNTDGVAPAEPPPAAPSTQKKRGKQKERAATESLTAEKPDGRMGSTGLKRCPVTPGSKPLAPAPADNAGNYGDGPASQSPVAMPQPIGKFGKALPMCVFVFNRKI